MIFRNKNLKLSYLFLFLTIHFSLQSFSNSNCETLNNNMISVNIKVHDNFYIIPYGYLSPRLPIKNIKELNIWKGFSFAFWMPDGNFVEKDPFYAPNFRPDNDGEAGRISDRFIVRVLSGLSLIDYPAIDPLDQFNNIKNNSNGIYELSKKDDLMMLSRKYKDLKSFYFYYGDLGVGTRFVVSCRPRQPGDIDPICSSDIRIDKYNMNFKIIFPEDQGSNIKLIVEKLESLVSDWHQSN